MNLTEILLQMQDVEYKAFHCKLMPTIDRDRVIGIRVPLLRKMALDLHGKPVACEFLAKLPHTYYEENNLHALLIEQIEDFHDCVIAVDRFLPFIDNWATCDSLRPKCFKHHKRELLPYIKGWLASEQEYAVRFGIGMLMVHYLDDAFDPTYLKIVACVDREEYYIKMMVAWYFAAALAKQYTFAVKYLEEYKLPAWTHNKSIQKAVESDRIPLEEKCYLKTLRRRGGV